MSTPKGRCPLCGEPNAYANALCRRCNFRLPWADRAENFANVEGEVIPRDSPVLPEICPDPHPAKLSEVTPRSRKNLPRCRFCGGVIEATMKNCPHCKEWLVLHGADLDPLHPSYSDRDFDRTPVKAHGCLMGILLLLGRRF